MHIGSLVVTFFCAVLYGILSVEPDTGMVSLIFCLPVTLICTIIGLIKSEGKKKLLVIPVQAIIWLVCSLFGASIFKGMLAVAILFIGGIVLFHVFGNMFGKGEEKTSSEEEDAAPQKSFGEWMPDTLYDENDFRWEKDYAGPNIARYHCNSNGQSVELIEGITQYYSDGNIKGSDGRTYHCR